MFKEKVISIINFFRQNKRYIYLEYGVFMLTIIWPLLGRGYIFAPDLNWPIAFHLPNQYTHLYLFNLLLTFLNDFLPSWLIEKFLFIAIIYTALISMHKFIRTNSDWPKYFAAVLYVINPFFYDRLMYGQLYQLAAYALLPLSLFYLNKLINDSNLINTIKLAVVYSLIAIFSYHFIIIALVPSLLYVIIKLIISIKNKQSQNKLILYFFILLPTIFFILNFYWLVPIKGPNIDMQMINKITSIDKITYQTLSGGRNLFVNALFLHGFWGENSKQFYVVKDHYAFNTISMTIILLLSLSGAFITIKNKKDTSIALTLIISALVALVLGIGIAFKPFEPLVSFLEKFFNFYKGYREPQKFIALLVVAYCFFGAKGMESIINMAKQKIKEFVILVFMGLVLFSNIYIYNGAAGQLFVSNYPESWFQVKSIIEKNPNNHEKTLFLPWHQYMSYSFVKNKLVSTLGCSFFGSNTLCGDNEEVGVIFSSSQRPFSESFEKNILTNIRDNPVTNNNIDLNIAVANLFQEFNIKYIILVKEVDWQKYSFLDRQNNLKIIFDSAEIKLYENETFQ